MHVLQKIEFKPSVSSRPGVVLHEADFDRARNADVPFAGGRFVIEPGATSKPDTHQVSECWMIASGRGVLNYDGIDYEVAAGQYLLFEPMKTHYMCNTGDTPVVIHTVWWLEGGR